VDTGDESKGSDDEAEHSDDDEDQQSQGEKVNFFMYLLSLIFEIFILLMSNQSLTKYFVL
jgi:hypothetical protein